MQIIYTDANVTHDQPIDYGIHQFCQECKVCVDRCPGRALMPDKVWYRGVEKNKLVFKRCRPVMARYEGCGVCMKVCPIQKYGMKPVMEHYVETGEVLGKRTENLEGYALSDKGYFGPGKLPSFKRDFFDMPHGRAEDWVFIEFRDKLMDMHGDMGNGSGNGHSNGNGGFANGTDEMWTDFRGRVEQSLVDREAPADMGMDRGI